MKPVFLYILKGSAYTKEKEKEETGMDKARRKLRACLIVVVTAAVIIGMVYYFHDVKGNSDVSGGTLIAIPEGTLLWR